MQFTPSEIDKNTLDKSRNGIFPRFFENDKIAKSAKNVCFDFWNEKNHLIFSKRFASRINENKTASRFGDRHVLRKSTRHDAGKYNENFGTYSLP